QQVFLLGIERNRGLDDHPAEKVAGGSSSHRPHTLLTHPEHAAGLGFARDLEHHLAIQGGHFHRSTQRRGREADRHLAGEMTALTLEYRMLAYSDLDVQVAGRTPVAAGFALAVQTDAVTGIDPCWDRHRQSLLFAHSTLSVAGVTGIGNDLAPS